MQTEDYVTSKSGNAEEALTSQPSGKKHPIRVLIVSDHYPPFIGGAHRQSHLLAHQLANRGYEVRVATVWHSGVPEVQEDGKIIIYRLRQLRTALPGWPYKPGQRYQPPFPDPITTIGLRRLIKQFNPDIINSYGWISYSCAVALTGLDIPLLLSVRDYAYSCATRSLVYRGQLCSGPGLKRCVECAGELYGKPKGLIAAIGVYTGKFLLRRKMTGLHNISSYVGEIMHRDFLPRSSNHPRYEAIIPSFRSDEPVNSSLETSDLSALQELPEVPFILFVGAIRVVKGVEQLLQAYQRLQNPPPLVLIGTLEQDSPTNFPPGVILLEKLPHKAVMLAWERCLFGVTPSLWPEPLGSVVHEGMSKGKAMIGTTPGGHTDMIIHGETGLLVSVGDVEALAQAMQRLLDKPDLREKMGWAAFERAKIFTSSVSMPKFEQLFNKMVEREQD